MKQTKTTYFFPRFIEMHDNLPRSGWNLCHPEHLLFRRVIAFSFFYQAEEYALAINAVLETTTIRTVVRTTTELMIGVTAFIITLLPINSINEISVTETA